MIVGFHALDGSRYGPVTEGEFRHFLNHISTKDLWVDTFGAVTRYLRERESASLYVVSISSEGMVLRLTDNLDDVVYGEELTVRSEGGWGLCFCGCDPGRPRNDGKFRLGGIDQGNLL